MKKREKNLFHVQCRDSFILLEVVVKISIVLFLSFLFCQNVFSELISIVPNGKVSEIKQIVLNFNTEMIAMGDSLAKTDIINKECFDQAGSKIPFPASYARWNSNVQLLINLSENLASGLKCNFSLVEGTKDLKGNKLKTDFVFNVESAEGKVLKVYPETYQGIEPDQYFVVKFDSEIDLKSLVDNAYFEILNIKEKVKVKAIEGNEREELLSFLIDKSYFFYDEKTELNNLKNQPEEYKKYKESFLTKVAILGAERKFPDNSKASLVFPNNIKTKISGSSIQEKSFNFFSNQEFKAEFSCIRANENEACSPIEPMYLQLTKDTKALDLVGVKLISSKGVEWLPIELKDKSLLTNNTYLNSLTFVGPFPESEKFEIVIPKKIKDIIGRELNNESSYPLKVATSEYAPLVKFTADFGIIEWTKDSSIPMSVRNIENKILFKQNSLNGKSIAFNKITDINRVIDLYKMVLGWENNIYDQKKKDTRNFPLIGKNEGKLLYIPKPNGDKAYEMVGIPIKEPGFHIVEIESPRLGKALTVTGKKMYVPTAVLVTNMGIHFKRGEEGGLVFVTQLNDASPVEGAEISVRDCDGTELYFGKTSKNGTLKINGDRLYYSNRIDRSSSYKCSSLYVFAKKGDDFTFMNSSWDKGIESYRFGVNTKYMYEKNNFQQGLLHTILDRALFKPGETVSMQHVLRESKLSGLKNLDKTNWPKIVYIKHSSSERIYSIPLKVNPINSDALSYFKIPKDIIYGKYDVYLSKREKVTTSEEESNLSLEYDRETIYATSFMVSDYRLPLMQANIKILGENLVKPLEFEVDSSIQYLSGGPAKKIPVKISKQIQYSNYFPEFIGSNEYSFFNYKIKDGIQSEENVSEIQDNENISIVLDDLGGNRSKFKLRQAYEIPQRIFAEIEYTDPNGEIKTANTFKTIFPSNYLIGIKIDSWITDPNMTKVEGVVVDLNNKLVSNAPFEINGFLNKYYSHRKRMVGGFYSYDNTRELKNIGKLCSGFTDSEGRFVCELKGLPVGVIELEATTSDENKNTNYARYTIEVVDPKIDRWMMSSDSDRIDILPAEKEGVVGKTMKLLIKTPFKKSTALITVERESVLDSYVVELDRSNPIFELPIKENYAPNVFVSALLVRGRIEEHRKDFLVDLNRPSIKLGIIPLKVGWGKHVVKVAVSANKKRYFPRETAQIKIKVLNKDEKINFANTHVTLIGVDEALNILKRNNTIDVLATMMQERPLAVDTSSGITQVIGKRHYGQKAKNPGGDGGIGDGSMRELFDTLLVFKPNIKLDENGEALVDVKLNDSMTSFKFVAIAFSNSDKFGYGSTDIVSMKDLIVYSGVAPHFYSGDDVKNKYTVRNTSSYQMNIKFKVKAVEIGKEYEQEAFKLQPGESKVINFNLKIPENFQGKLTFEAYGSDEELKINDQVKTISQVSLHNRPITTMATIFQLEKEKTISVKEPENAIRGLGAINIDLSKSILNSLSGVKNYMQNYPYSCLEQQISKGIALENTNELKAIVSKLPNYLDEDSLLRFFNSNNLCGSVGLTNYVVQVLTAANISIPEKTKASLILGLKNWMNSNLQCYPWWYKFMRDDFRTEEKISVFRSLSEMKAFDPKMLQTIKIDLNNWSTLTNLNFRKILINEKSLPKRDELLKQVNTVLRNQLILSGTSLTLKRKSSQNFYTAIQSSSDEEAMKYFYEINGSKDVVDNFGALANGLVKNMKKGRYDTTMANAWAVLAFNKFSKTYESEKISGVTSIQYEDQNKNIEWNESMKSQSIDIGWSKKTDTDIPLTIKHANGKPWVNIQTKSALALKEPLSLGYSIYKDIEFVSQKRKGQFSVGDILNVKLKISANNDQPWVAIFDPIYSGSSYMNNGFDSDSGLEVNSNSSNFPEEFSEKMNKGIYIYAGYLQKGIYEYNYQIRLNSAGKFSLANTHVEAMYSTDLFGEFPNKDIEVIE